MPPPPPGREALSYVVSFVLPGAICPVARAGQLWADDADGGAITAGDCCLPLTPDEFAFCRKVIQFWLGAQPATQRDRIAS